MAMLWFAFNLFIALMVTLDLLLQKRGGKFH
jgi:hypothetical protein